MDENLVAEFFEQNGFWFGMPKGNKQVVEPAAISGFEEDLLLHRDFPGFFGFRCYPATTDDGGSQQLPVSFWM